METKESSNIELKEKFAKERQEWNEKVDKLGKKLKNVFDVPMLMTDLYTERQRAVEYYHYLGSLIIKINKQWRAQYAERWDYYTNKAQVRYPNESVKNNRIYVDLADFVEKKEMIENHMKFIDRSISTIDNIIFAVPKRVEIENIARGK
jgi:hypothetical protein